MDAKDLTVHLDHGDVVYFMNDSGKTFDKFRMPAIGRDLRHEIGKILGDMLDNQDVEGLYPTTKAGDALASLLS